MKVLALNGSPRRNGNCVRIVNEIAKGAKEAGHDFTSYNVYDLDINGCKACSACKGEMEDLCVLKDDFLKVGQQIVEADCIIMASPVYIGQVTGPMKTFLDRWYTFVQFSDDGKFSFRYIPGKKFIAVVTYAAPQGAFDSVSEYLNYWLEEMWSMKNVGTLSIGDLGAQDAVESRNDVLEKAFEIGKSL